MGHVPNWNRHDRMIEKLLHALLGGFLGALIAVSTVWFWADDINWIFVGVCAGCCAVLSFAWGKPFLEWLSEIWWWT